MPAPIRTLPLLVLFFAIAGGVMSAQSSFGIREESHGEHRVVIDERQAEFSIALPVERTFGREPGSRGAPVYPTLAALAKGEGKLFLSVAVLEAAAKRFDDRLYASIELLLHLGSKGRVLPKPKILLLALANLEASADPGASAARARLAAALLLLDAAPELPADLRAAADALVRAFDADEKRSKPLGFYTWADELRRIFRADRFLQTTADLDAGDSWIQAMGRSVSTDQDLRQAYERVLQVASRLTNPLSCGNAIDAIPETSGSFAFYPASRSLEGDLFKRLYGARPIPDGVVLMDEFIAAIRAGKVDLKPTAASGWYDHQTYALEPLLLPEAASEAAKVRGDREYRKFCEQVFKATLTKRRETHVKQLEMPAVGAAAPMPPRIPTFVIQPRLRLEPQITYLRRTADAYAFLREALVGIFGEGLLESVPLYDLDRGPSVPLHAALLEQEIRFRALAAMGTDDVGGDPTFAGAGLDAGAARALADRAGAEFLPTEADLAYDPRVMVPVAFDVERRLVRCWAVVGVAARTAEIRYAKAPAVSVVGQDGQRVPASGFKTVPGTQYVRLPYEVWIECAVPVPLSREEFRKVCDEHRTPERIRAALEGR